MYLLFDYFLGMQKALNDPIADLIGDLFWSKVSDQWKLRSLHVWQHSWFVQRSLTAVSGRLQAVFGDGAPAHGEDVPGVKAAPVIERPPPAVEHHEHLFPLHLADGGRTDQVRVLLVHGLQFHPGLEAVLGRPQRLLMGLQSVSVTKTFYRHLCKSILSRRRRSSTFLNAVAGAISAPLRVLRRNMGHEEAFILNPEKIKEERRDYYPWFCSNVIIFNISQSRRRENAKTGSWRQAK